MKSTTGLDRLYAPLFVLFGALFALVIQLKLPPFMGPDELNHLKRANLIALGRPIGERIQLGGPPIAGGPCEPSLNQAGAYYAALEFHPERKVDPGAAAAASSMQWGSVRTDQPFENTAVYPPFLYLPAAFAIGLGKVMSLSVIRTLQMARFANTVLCLAIGWLAIHMGGRVRPLLFTILLLPMSVALFSSVTQDGPMIALCALVCALMCRSIGEGTTMLKGEVIGATICLSIVGMAKPPYVLLTLLLILVPMSRREWRWYATGAALSCEIVWHVCMAVKVQTPLLRPDAVVDAGAQVGFLLHHPLSSFTIAFNTVRHFGGVYISECIGVLGWLDTVLPKAYYGLALVVLFGAATSIASTTCPSKRVSGWALAVLALTTIALFIGIYVVYTPVGFAYVEGVQGRYLLPIAAIGPMILAGRTRERKEQTERFSRYAQSATLALPLASIAVVFEALSRRYY